MKQYKSTFFILLTCVFLEVFFTLFPSARDVFAFRPDVGLLGWVGFLPHIFSHGGWGHLIGNFTFGLPFMLYLENKLGNKRLLELYIICGLSGALFNMFCEPQLNGCIGSSGAIMGMMGAACMLFGSTLWEHLGAIALLMCLLAPNIFLAQYQLLAGIGFYAHIGGCLTGIILAHKLYRGKHA